MISVTYEPVHVIVVLITYSPSYLPRCPKDLRQFVNLHRVIALDHLFWTQRVEQWRGVAQTLRQTVLLSFSLQFCTFNVKKLYWYM